MRRATGLGLAALTWVGLAIAGLAVAGDGNGGGPSAAPAAASKAEPPHYTGVRRLPDEVTLAALSNGLTVIVQENHAAPVATVRCFVKNTGSAFEGKNLGAGLSHVLEHVVAGGTTTHRTREGNREDHRHVRRSHQRLHVNRHDDVLHRLPGQEHA